MNTYEQKMSKLVMWFILLQPVLDIITSVMVRYISPSLTLGMIVRMLFVGLAALYLLFVYQGQYKVIFRVLILLICGYGGVSIGISAYHYGLHTIVENAKMFFKMYYFLFALMFFFALYVKHGFTIDDRAFLAAFVIYAGSIFLSAITDTSFVTYEYAEGYCGWFYAGNEVGAVVSILAIIALTTALNAGSIPLRICIPALLSFCSVYIGTKVPFWAGIGAVAVPMVLSGVQAVFFKNKASAKSFGILLGTLLLMFTLFQLDSPMKRNNETMMGWHYEQNVTQKLEEAANSQPQETLPPETLPPETVPAQTEAAPPETMIVEEPEATEQTVPEQEQAAPPENTIRFEDSKLYTLINWLLSNRLEMIKPAIAAYSSSTPIQKLFGLGYQFVLPGGETYNSLIEMDFIALVINHGILGFAIYMAAILLFAFLCLKKFFQRIRCFFSMEKEISYFYSLLIGFGCAFLAGHVLVAPSVSIYLAVIIVNLYARLYSPDFPNCNSPCTERIEDKS